MIYVYTFISFRFILTSELYTLIVMQLCLSAIVAGSYGSCKTYISISITSSVWGTKRTRNRI